MFSKSLFAYFLNSVLIWASDSIQHSCLSCSTLCICFSSCNTRVVFVLKCQQQLLAVWGFQLQVFHETLLVSNIHPLSLAFNPVPGDSCCFLSAVLLKTIHVFVFSFFLRMSSSVGVTRLHFQSFVVSALLIAYNAIHDVAVRFAGVIVQYQWIVCLWVSLGHHQDSFLPLFMKRLIPKCMSGRSSSSAPAFSRTCLSSGLAKFNNVPDLIYAAKNIYKQRHVHFHVRTRRLQAFTRATLNDIAK